MLTPDNSNESRAWIIDDTLIPVHDQSITAISKNYRRSATPRSSSAPTGAALLRSGAAGSGNRNDVMVARHTVAPLLDGTRLVLGDGG